MTKWNKKKSKSITPKTETLVDILRSNESFNAILAAARTPEEKRAIKAYTEQFLNDFQKSLSIFKDEVEKNPKAIYDVILEMSKEPT